MLGLIETTEQPPGRSGWWMTWARRVATALSYSGVASRNDLSIQQWVDHGTYCATLTKPDVLQ
jgi:hypothetical protein